MGNDEKLEINKDYEVRKIHFDGKGKRHSTFLGILTGEINSNQPIKSKLWASAFNPGLKSFNHFGSPLPKRISKDENSVKIQVWMGIFEMFKDSAIKSTWTDTFMRFNYDVLSVGDIKVYYYKGTPRYIENNGEKLLISQTFPELEMKKFEKIEDVK